MTWWLMAMAPEPGVGVTFGVFGAGGSAFATPGPRAPRRAPVRSPSRRRSLRCCRPRSPGAREYLRAGLLDRRVAALAVVAGVPAVDRRRRALRLRRRASLLVALSGVMLFVVGVRMAWPTRAPWPDADTYP